MSLRLQSVTIDRKTQPHQVVVTLFSSKGESISVQLPLEPPQDVEHLSLLEIERMALEQAKKFFSQAA